MNKQEMLGRMRKAVSEYKLIDGGDRIAVGLSGGKDSLTLLMLLAAYRRFAPQKFELCAVTVDLGFEPQNTETFKPLETFCASLDVPFHLVRTEIGEATRAKTPDAPCSLCSNMRRGVLCGKLNELGFNKLALGHHSDDVTETFLLSIFFEGRLSTFAPKSFMSRTGVTVIRPLIFIGEKEITAFAKDFPIVKNPCPTNHNTRREDVKMLIKELDGRFPDAAKMLTRAVRSPERYNLWDKTDDENLNGRTE